MKFDIPDNKVIVLSQAEKFVECLKIAAKECGCSDVDYNKICGVIKFNFKDGSSIGGKRAWVEAGIIPREVLEPIKLEK